LIAKIRDARSHEFVNLGIFLATFVLRLPYTFRGVSRPSDVARPV